MNPADPPEYEAEFASLHRGAQRAAYVILGDRDLACDIAQEVLFKAFQRWSRIATYATPWVTRAATNQALSTVRSSKRRSRREQVVAATVHDDEGDSGLAESALRADLAEQLGRLPRRQRDVVVLRHLHGFSEHETAAAMGVSIGSVKSHSHRARATLRERLGGDYFLEVA